LIGKDVAAATGAAPAGRTFSAEAVVDLLYRGLLQREPDASGLADKSGRILSGAATPLDICREITGSVEFTDKLPLLLAGGPARSARRFTNDVSQYGEIWELVRHWVNDAVAARVVVDVGARGLERSNSYDLCHHFGWRGLLVEANPALIDPLAQDFADLDIAIVQTAVSDYDGEATFTLGINDDVSSLDAGTAANWGETRGSVVVPVRRLAGILDDARIPDRFGLLSLDIEGEDIKVLNDLLAASRYRPDWIIIEASEDFQVRSLDDARFSDAVRQDYVLRAQTRSNLILHRADLVPGGSAG
jgi:FkbM family methyltransferase